MVKKLDWDSDFFGFPIGRIDVNADRSLHNVEELAKEFKLIYFFSDYALDWPGLKHVDTKLIFQKKVIHREESVFNNLGEISFSSFNLKTDSYDEIENLAYLSGEFSRYKLDEKFGENNFRKLYKKWLDESINKNIADYILVAQYKTRIIGFVTLRIDNYGTGQIGLIAVDPESQGRKIASKLIRACEEKINDGQFLNVSTQEANLGAVKLYYKNDFEVVEKKYIYHYWQ
ncbi:dTDP-4-amino-4,6-dideoxy-D-galactose acyltransferase [Marivirga sericea]|uniref:dTDP-4-amino-4,6-dideoxy-D-galactose acyltransferase n=1 Tax=Marivirga sericea TaxID=1028 RepID=A0A1X7J7B2_9BACT|nr:GNAT family N-acetyltransferase [Marivirga sericea]SMG23586.1 dTDP-4-amino-4,6-dideoxy-D-galactose acyltransferase [Marivirga sericea]